MTYRQYITWLLWEEEEWNQPSRSDHYLMQIACEVRRVLSGKPNLIQPHIFRLKFRTDNVPSKAQVGSSKARWFRWVGLKPKRAE